MLDVWKEIARARMTTLVRNQKALEDILSDEEFWQEVRKEVLTAVLPLFQELLFGGVEFASAAEVAYKALALKQVSVAGIVADEDRLTSELLGFLPGYTDEWWSSIEQTTRDSMRGAIQASIVAGEPVDKLIPRLETLFSPVRAQRIAVTETTRLFNEGAKRTYRAAGVEYVEWSTVMDDRVCSTCMDLQSESRAKPWLIDSPTVNPPAHVNCRCHLIPVVEDRHTPQTSPEFAAPEGVIKWGDNPWKQYEGVPKPRAVSARRLGEIRDALNRQGRANADGTISIYHVTTPDVTGAIRKQGLVPSGQPAPGQQWEAEHSRYATYFHTSQEVALRDVSQMREMGGEAALIEAQIPLSPKALQRILPDEDFSDNIAEGLNLLTDGGPVAVVGGVPADSLRVVPEDELLSLIESWLAAG